MQEDGRGGITGGWEGGNNSPPGWFSSAGLGRFWPSSDVFVGQTDSGPALLSGPGLAQTKIGEFVGPRSAQPFWG
jgi:hypothetical protein